MYVWYRKRFNDKSISQPTFTSICHEFNSEIMRVILEEGFKFYVPSGLGIITVVKRNKGSIDGVRQVNWAETNKIGKYVFHENDHTNGYFYRFLWRRLGYNFKNKTMYIFDALRRHKKRLNQILRDPSRSIDYLDTRPKRNDSKHMNKIFKR